jgi:hypothetical protein
MTNPRRALAFALPMTFSQNRVLNLPDQALAGPVAIGGPPAAPHSDQEPS